VKIILFTPPQRGKGRGKSHLPETKKKISRAKIGKQNYYKSSPSPFGEG
jgi:hypothetical protein